MTILLTGGTGFIGRYLSGRLSDPAGGGMTRLVRDTPRAEFNEQTDVSGDLANPADVERLVGLGTVLVHLACTSNPRSSNRDIVADLEQNLLPTVSLFERFAVRQPGGHIIFASSGGDMYSFDPPHYPRHEDDPAEPRSSYSIHKLAAERYLQQFCRVHGVAGSILRISNPYGTPISEKRGHGLIGVALSTLRTETELPVIDTMDSVRDYLHLDDLTAAFQAVVDNPPPSGACRVMNVGSGIGYSISDVFAAIERATSRRIRWRYDVAPGRSPTWNVLDCSRIRETTGWQVQIGLEQGIERLWGTITAGSSIPVK